MPTDSVTHIDFLLMPQPDTTVSAEEESDNGLLLCYDSISAAYRDVPVQYRESMMAGNGHTTESPKIETHLQNNNDWIFGIFLLFFATLSIYLNSHNFKLRDIFISMFDLRVLERVFREHNIRTRTFLPMTGIYLAILALAIVNVNKILHTTIFSGSALIEFLAVFAALTLILTAKNTLIRLIGNIFNDQQSSMSYIYNNYLFYFWGALVTLPLIMVSIYFSPASVLFLQIALIAIAIIFIVRLLRGLYIILSNSNSSNLYLFLYLCIFEIVPILLLIKAIIN